MFSHKISNIPNQNYLVESYPTIDQTQEMMEKARKVSGIRHNYLWEVKEEFKKYTLSLLCKEEGDGDLDWWMHEENVVGTRLVWFHKTKDISVIYPFIMQAVGATHAMNATLEEREEARKAKEKDKPTSLGAQLKRKKATSADLLPTPSDNEAAAAPDATEQASVIRLMSGNLRSRPIAWLLQTAKQAEVTGELRVDAGNDYVIIQFGLGRPVHAIARNKVGTEAVLELFAWSEGEASFVEGKQPDAASVQDSLDEIMKQGTKLLENLAFLQKNNLDENSILSRPPIGLSDEQLEQKLKDGPDHGFKVQRNFYKALDGQSSLKEIGDRIALDKSRLMAVAVNFLKLGLLLTPDGRSLRQIAPSTSSLEAFASSQSQSQSGAQPALKPPPGFFNVGTANGDASQGPSAGGTGEIQDPTLRQSGPRPAISPAAYLKASQELFRIEQPDHRQQTPGFQPGPQQDPQGSTGPQRALQSQQGVSGPQKALHDPQASTGSQKIVFPGHVEREFFDVGPPSSIVTFDQAAVQATVNAMTNRQTGAVTFPAFQFFLEREFARAFRFGTEFSLLIFCIRLGGNTGASPTPALPIKSLGLATSVILQIKREVDVFGHFGDKCFGLILPGVSAGQSVGLADRITAELPQLAPQLGGMWPILHFGIAGVPQDARDLPSLVDAAQKAMIEAADKNYARILFSDLS